MKPITLLTLLILSVANFTCYSQTTKTIDANEVRPEIARLVKGIEKDNVLKSSGVGEAGTKTEQWNRYESLSKNATTSELISLTDHKNGVVRCYAFDALLKRPDADHYAILLHHLKDTVSIETFQGCIISSSMVGDYFLDVASPPMWIEGTDSTIYNSDGAFILSRQQQIVIDSILIFDKEIFLVSKYDLLRTLQPNEKYYSRVREIATKENSPVSTLALSRFKNPADIGIIELLFKNEKTEYHAAYCAREFPDTTFYPLLVKIFEKKWSNKYYDYPLWRILYQALARYPTEQTYQLFKRTTDCKDVFRYQTLGTYLMIAISKYPDKLYDPLKSKIKLDKYHQEEVKQQMDTEK